MAAPANTVSPAVTGIVVLFQTLTSTHGTWTDDGSPAFTYQWQVSDDGSTSWTNISSATVATYLIARDKVNKYLRCNVTDTDSNGATAKASNVVGSVALPPIPISSKYPQPAYVSIRGLSMVADGSGVYANRYLVYTPSETAQIHLTNATATGWTAKALIPSPIGGYDRGDIVASGVASGNTVTLGTFLPGSYSIELTGASTDPLYGPSYGRTILTVLRPHAGFPAPMPSTFTQFNWIPNGFGRTAAEVNVGSSNGGTFDMIMRAICSMGVGRTSIEGSSNPFNMNGGSSQRLTDAVEYFTNVVGPYWLSPTDPAWADSVRPRTGWLNFPNFFTCYDALQIQNDGGQPSYITWANIYVKSPSVDGSKVFVTLTAGTTGGTAKLKVFYPNNSTLVETYDNLADGSAAETAVNTSSPSSYVRVWNGGSTGFTAVSSATAITTAVRDQVVTIVSTLYPLGCTRYEGPENEPTPGTEVAHQFWLFQDAVHTGNPAAKAIGPTPVNIGASNLTRLGTYLDYLATNSITPDGIAIHSYNTGTNGDINQARADIEQFLASLKTKGLTGIEVWQTEALQSLTMGNAAPVWMPSHARVGLLMQLLWEQYGVPRERNPFWYDTEHGFWGYPSWIVGVDNSLQPQVVLFSVLGQETFRKNHHHRIDFGSVQANALFVGSVYGDPKSGSTAVMCCASSMPNSTVTLTVTGTTSPLTVVDGAGSTTTKTPDGSGRITVDVNETGGYVRLPAGVTVSVYSVRDWSHNPSPSISATKLSAKLGGASTPGIGDGTFMGHYNGLATAGLHVSGIDLPDTAEIKFAANKAIERLLIFCGPCYQAMPGLLNYTVDTWDGSSWTTRETITRSPSSYLFGDPSATGMTRTQMWGEQWIEDVKLTGGPITCKGIRLSVPTGGLSYGAAVDAAADQIMEPWGQSSGSTPKLALQEMMVISATSAGAGTAYDSEVTTDTPSGYWKLNEAPGATTVVSQVNSPAMDGTPDGVTFGEPGLLSSSADTSAGFIDDGIHGSGHRAHFDVAAGTHADLGDVFSVEFWFDTTILNSGTRKIFDKNVGANGAPTVTIDSTIPATVNLGKTSGGVFTLIASSSGGLVTNNTYHVVCTKNGSASHIYINGEDLTVAGTNATCTDNASVIRWGDNASNFQSNIQAGAIYPGVELSAARVLAHYVAGIAAAAPVNVTKAFIEGTPSIGSQIQASFNTTLDWTGGPTSFSYQWQQSANGTTGWSNLSGETRSDLNVTGSHAGKYLSALQTGTSAGGDSSAIRSQVVGPVDQLLTGVWGIPR